MSTLQVIPAGLDARFCGHVYLIAFIDNTNIVTETMEDNNQIARHVFIKCYQGVCAYWSTSVPSSLSPTFVRLVSVLSGAHLYHSVENQVVYITTFVVVVMVGQL